MAQFSRRRLLGTGLVTASAYMGTACPALAQMPVSHAVRVIVGYAPGGPTDTVARLYAVALRGIFAPQVIVDNRPGAGGRLAVEMMKAAPNDGTVLLISPGSVLTLQPHIYPQLVHYDGLADLLPAATLGIFSTGLAVPIGHPARSYGEFIIWLRAQPPPVIFASPAAGSGPHVIGARMGQMLDVELTHAPYRGTGPALQDLIAGRLPMLFAPLGDLVPRHGQELRILAISAPRRVERISEVPTFAELGRPELTLEDWIGAFLPRDTSRVIQSALAEAIRHGARTAATIAGLQKMEIKGEIIGPDELTTRLRQERSQWSTIVREARISVEE